MYPFKVIFVILIFYIQVVYASHELKIVFWLESTHMSAAENFKQSVTEIESQITDTKLSSIFFVVHRNIELEADNINKFCQILSSADVNVVFDFTFYPWHAGLDYVRTFNIPYFPFARVLLPFFKMFSDLMEEKSADDIIFIMQNAQDFESALFQMLFGYPFKILLINTEEDFVERLHNLRPNPTYYAIFANTKNMNQIFKKIKNGGIFSRPYEWHFIFLDGQHEAFAYRNDVISATKCTVNTNEICHTLQINTKYCGHNFMFEHAVVYNALQVLMELVKIRSDRFKSQNILCNNTSTNENMMSTSGFDILSYFERKEFLMLLPTTDNLFMEEDGEYPLISYILNVSISVYQDENLKELSLALWESGNLTKINETISAGKRFFRIGVAQAIPWNYYKRNEITGEVQYDEEGKPIWEGFCIDLVQTLSIKLNFEYELVEPKIGKFGQRNPDTLEWDGVVGDLVSGNTHFAVTALKMYSEREEVIDFVAPYFEQTGISIVIRKPVRETSLFKFLTVLRLEVWLGILASLIATSLLLWLLDKYSPYSARNNKEAYPYPCRDFTLRECFWFSLTSFTPQGGGEAPKAISSRILVAAYWLFVVLMLATFTANLAAFLTVERMQTPVQTLEQLGRQSRINYSVVADSDTHEYFINMKFAEDTLYRMWKELALNVSKDFHKFRVWDYPIKEQYGTILLAINSSGPVTNATEGFKKVNEHENADYAFIHDSSEIKYEITKNCNLTEVGEVFAEQPYALAIQQGSHLSDELSYVLLELQKDRYFEELKAKYWNTSRLKACSSGEGNAGITLESLGGVFIATFFGLLLALTTLILEVLYYKRKQKKKTSFITEVKVAFGNTVDPIKKEAWTTTDIKIPSIPIEVATSRMNKAPAKIILGGDEFKPRRQLKRHVEYNDHHNLFRLSKEGLRARDSQLPPYME